jgi:hypothetical protein
MASLIVPVAWSPAIVRRPAPASFRQATPQDRRRLAVVVVVVPTSTTGSARRGAHHPEIAARPVQTEPDREAGVIYWRRPEDGRAAARSSEPRESRPMLPGEDRQWSLSQTCLSLR